MDKQQDLQQDDISHGGAEGQPVMDHGTVNIVTELKKKINKLMCVNTQR